MIPLHEHVLDRLNAYLDRTLSPADSSVVRRHCESCPSCRAGSEKVSAARGAMPAMSGNPSSLRAAWLRGLGREGVGPWRSSG